MTTSTSPSDEDVYFTIIGNTIDILITIASLAFFWSFVKLKDKTYGLYMILVLNILDFLFPVINLLSKPLVQGIESARIFTGITSAVYHFALYWTTAIAIFLLLVLKYKKTFNPRSFMLSSGLICLLVSLNYPIMVLTGAFGIEVAYNDAGKFFVKSPEKFSQHLTYLIVFDVIGKLVPILFTFVCYWNVHKLLTGPSSESSVEKPKVAPRVLWYSGIQFICFFPGIFSDILSLFGLNRPFQLNLMVFTLHHAWGFLNLVVYWFLRPSDGKQRKGSFESSYASEVSFSRSGNENSMTALSNF